MGVELLKKLPGLAEEQLAVWPEARLRYSGLESIKVRSAGAKGLTLQHNPSRVVSASAKTDTKAIRRRACFLCPENRPEEQMCRDLGDGFSLLLNPYPILKNHFTVVCNQHKAQSVYDCYVKMLEIASALPEDYMVFYNGPRSGASAPDHLHLQIGNSAPVPLVQLIKSDPPSGNADYITIRPWGFAIKVYVGASPERLKEILDSMPLVPGECEPRLNLVAFNYEGKLYTLVIPRTKHRPDCYYKAADRVEAAGGGFLVSPGAVDMCGLIIIPREEDFNTLTEQDLLHIYREVTPQQPGIRVGVMASGRIEFSLESPYYDGKSCISPGRYAVELSQGRILWQGGEVRGLELVPTQAAATFTLHGVTIGVGFHWERKEDQRFVGSLGFVVDGDRIWAVNELPVEEYLKSVISSEMKATASMEFMKAHAVISRSWLLAQTGHGGQRDGGKDESCAVQTQPVEEGRVIKWYDHEQHTLFDVCADDHCQRYQGITRIISPEAGEAVDGTYGEVLLNNGTLCDARFSKCCGGVSEEFEYCWQDCHKPYLESVACAVGPWDAIDLREHAQAEKWILSRPQAFCSSVSGGVLARVLNNYDMETQDFYRWSVSFTTEEISAIFTEKTGMDLGLLEELTPLKRGRSGRIYELLVKGSKGSVVVGKEVEIRRALSKTHLLSSAFAVTRTGSGFTLHGAGWGHGAGLCQIGAAVMGERGFSYKEILTHYYSHVTVAPCY